MSKTRNELIDLGILGWDAYYCYESPGPGSQISVTTLILDSVIRIFEYNPDTEPLDIGLTMDGNPLRKAFDPNQLDINSRPNFEYLLESLKLSGLKSKVPLGIGSHSALAGGGQSYDITTELPSEPSIAYHNLRSCFEENGISVAGPYMLDFLQACLDLYNKEYVEVTGVNSHGKTTTKLVTGAEMYKRSCTIWPVVKQKERTKSSCRAIVELSLPFKCAQQITEELSAAINKQLNHSTAEIGGFEKQNVLEAFSSQAQYHIGQGRTVAICNGDSAKWNEAHSLVTFYMILWSIMEPFYTIDQIMIATWSILQWTDKRIKLGKGFKLRIDGFDQYVTFKKFVKLVESGWDPTCYQAYYDFYLRERQYFNLDENYIECNQAMMMGTLNHLSSTVFDFNWQLINKIMTRNYGITVNAALSSDDFVSWLIFDGPRWVNAKPTYEEIMGFWTEVEYWMKQLNINASLKKCTYSLYPNFEYTSQVHTSDGFIPFMGCEIGTLFLPGGNVGTDLAIATQTCAGLLQKGLGAITATTCMQLCVNFVRAIHSIDGHFSNPRSKLGKRSKQVAAEHKLHPKSIMIAHGGINPWLTSNLGLLEAALKDKFMADWYKFNVYGINSPFVDDTPISSTQVDRGRRQVTFKNAIRMFDSPNPDIKKNLTNDKRFKIFRKNMRDLTEIGRLCNEIALYIPRKDDTPLLEMLHNGIENLETIVRFQGDPNVTGGFVLSSDSSN